MNGLVLVDNCSILQLLRVKPYSLLSETRTMPSKQYDTKQKRAVKKQITEGVFEFIKTSRPDKKFKCFLCLPSTTAKDVAEALKQGVIDKNTKIIVIEKEESYLPRIKARLTKLGFGSDSRFIINKQISDITKHDIEMACVELDVDGIDLFYIDTCNCLTYALQIWIEKIVSYARTEDAVVVTNLLAARWVKDIKQYQNQPVSPLAGYNINKWAKPISSCLEHRTEMKTALTIGYKDTVPMMLCVNLDVPYVNTRKKNRLKKYVEYVFQKSMELQNLGYN